MKPPIMAIAPPGRPIDSAPTATTTVRTDNSRMVPSQARKAMLAVGRSAKLGAPSGRVHTSRGEVGMGVFLSVILVVETDIFGSGSSLETQIVDPLRDELRLARRPMRGDRV